MQELRGFLGPALVVLLWGPLTPIQMGLGGAHTCPGVARKGRESQARRGREAPDGSRVSLTSALGSPSAVDRTRIRSGQEEHYLGCLLSRGPNTH